MLIFSICQLLASVIMHMFCSLDCKTVLTLEKIDVAVINLVIYSTSTSYFYYILYCHSTFNILYSLIAGISSASVFIISMSNFIHEPKNRILKVIILGSNNVISCCFALYTRYWMDFKNDKYP
jgi:predicted membrane channel-forming protein YqfA (hemolysin III family)